MFVFLRQLFVVVPSLFLVCLVTLSVVAGPCYVIVNDDCEHLWFSNCDSTCSEPDTYCGTEDAIVSGDYDYVDDNRPRGSNDYYYLWEFPELGWYCGRVYNCICTDDGNGNLTCSRGDLLYVRDMPFPVLTDDDCPGDDCPCCPPPCCPPPCCPPCGDDV
jgi:hypothetical protein